jgi:hypothetical protein
MTWIPNEFYWNWKKAMELKGIKKEEDITWQKFEKWIGEQINLIKKKKV